MDTPSRGTETMRRVGVLLLSGGLSGALFPGCYLWHDASAATAPLDAAPSRVDGAVPVGGRDAATRRPDASLPDDEPDVLPDERPSDDPGADDWIDPPPSSTDPCCDVGEIVPLGPVGPAGFTWAVAAWEGTEWGLALRAWMEPTSFTRLDTNAHPTIPFRSIDAVAQAPVALAWGNHRFALLSSGTVSDPSRAAFLNTLDRDGTLLARWEVIAAPADGMGLTRYPAIHGWALALQNGVPDTDGTIRTYARLVDDRGVTVAHVELPPVPGERGMIELVSIKSRVVTVRETGDGAYVDTLVGPEAVSARATAHVFASEPVSVRATRLRDTVVVVAAERADAAAGIRALGLDPFGGSIGPVHTLPRAPGLLSTPGIAGDDIGGTALLCWQETDARGGRSAGTVWVALVGEDGAAIGTPMRVTDTMRVIGPCSVGSSGLDEFVVLINDIGAPEHTLYGARVTVRR